MDATDKLHLVSADISALPADLQTALNEGCRVSSCRTALLAALKLPQALIVEMNASGSSMTYTLFSSSGDTLGRSTGSCIGCLEDEKKRDLVLGEMVQDLFIKSEAKTLAEANAEAPVTVESATETASAACRGQAAAGAEAAAPGAEGAGELRGQAGAERLDLRRRRDAGGDRRRLVRGGAQRPQHLHQGNQ